MEPASRYAQAERSAGLLLWRVTLSWQRRVRSALAPHDLTHVQFVLLASLWWLTDHGGPPTQVQLAQHAHTDPMMTSQVIRKLEAAGLLTRAPDPADSRARRLELTDGGRTRLRGALADVEAADEAFFSVLGPRFPGFLAAIRTLSEDDTAAGS